MKRSQFKLTIAKEKFEYLSQLQKKLDHAKFVAFVEKHKDYLTWYEDTSHGKFLLEEQRKNPANHDSRMFALLDKKKALADFSKTREYYTFEFYIPQDLFVVVDFQANVKKKHLLLLLDLANELDALLLNRGKKILDQAYIDTLPDD